MTAFADQILTRCELQRELKWKGSAKSSSSASRLSGGRGKGAARRTVRRASRSSCALPLDRSSESPRKSPRGPMEKEISASPSRRSEEHTSELQSLMRISYAVFCLKKKKQKTTNQETHRT